MPDEWWTEAGMRGFVPTFTAYRVNHRLFQNVHEVPIKYIGPVTRNSGVGIFNDSEKRVQAANESCEFCAVSGLTTLFRQWKSSRAKLDTPIAISSFTVRTASIVRWLRDLPAYRPLKILRTEQVSAEDTEGWQFSANHSLQTHFSLVPGPSFATPNNFTLH